MSLSADAQTILDRLTERNPKPSLAPTAIHDGEIDRSLRADDYGALFAGDAIRDDYAQAVLSGLNQMNDNLPRAHGLAMSEDVKDESARTTLDYWHAIMHRREPDYPNAKYWWRRTGHHPVFADVLNAAKSEVAALPSGSDVRRAIDGMSAWEPLAFTDLCEKHAASDNAENAVLRAIQAAEMARLLEYCVKKAAS